MCDGLVEGVSDHTHQEKNFNEGEKTSRNVLDDRMEHVFCTQDSTSPLPFRTFVTYTANHFSPSKLEFPCLCRLIRDARPTQHLLKRQLFHQLIERLFYFCTIHEVHDLFVLFKY